MVQTLKIATAIATLAITFPLAASAQSVTTSQGVVGQSGEEVYSDSVRGADGLLYNCRPGIVTQNGVPARLCQRTGGGFGGVTGIGINGISGPISGLVLLGVASAIGGTSDSTSGTN